MADREWTPEVVAAYDAAFAAGVREALQLGTGLLMWEARIAGKVVWAAAYPPAGLAPAEVLAWAREAALPLSNETRYFSPSELSRAASDLGLA